MHATYETQPLSFVVALASLFDVYELQLTEKDFAYCAMLVAACFKKENADDEKAKALGLALLRPLRNRLKQTGEVPLPKGDDIGMNLPEMWGIRALKKVEERLPESKRGRAMKQALNVWRTKNGHLATEAS